MVTILLSVLAHFFSIFVTMLKIEMFTKVLVVIIEDFFYLVASSHFYFGYFGVKQKKCSVLNIAIV